VKRIYSIPFGADFIDGLSTFILADGRPLGETAVVFPGKRPSLYLRRRLAEKLDGPFYAPAFFSIETFIDSLANSAYPTPTDLEYNDAIWLLYQAVLSLEPFRNHPLREKGFDRFYYWGQYLFSFIEQIDTENVSAERLLSLERNAELGYDVPESINNLLVNIILLRERFHAILDEEHLFTRGYKYMKTLQALDDLPVNQFSHIYFAGLFGLTGVEKEIVKRLWERGAGDIILEGNVEDWTILKNLVSYFGAEVVKIPSATIPPGRVKFYSGFDTHAEVLKVLKILKETESGKTVVVLPLSEALFPLLTFAVDRIDTSYNISLGYPLQRTPVFDLISNVVAGQVAMRERGVYPAKSYLKTALHPFVKNLTVDENLRALLLTLERALAGKAPGSPIAHRAFITLDDMERAAGIISAKDFPAPGDARRAEKALAVIHNLFFRSFEKADTLYAFAEGLEQLLDFILKNTPVRSYVLSGEIFTRAFELLEKVKETRFSKETFDKREKENRQTLCDFLLQFLRSATLPFETRPVEPLEIIGVLESRNLSFDTVIMLDVNEGVMPQPRKVDPLVPLGVYDKLGIPSPEYNEEIYRYYFYRLIRSAKDVHLLYIDQEDKPRSRYIEQIVWGIEKAAGALDVVPVDKTSYKIRLKPGKGLPGIEKTDEIWKALLTRTYSPSEIDDYIKCPVFFYFGRILRFEERKEVSEDMDVMDRGQIIHTILFDTFTPFKDREITPSMYNAVVGVMKDALEREFRRRVITGEFYLFKKLASFKLEGFLKRNVRDAWKPFFVKYLEHPFDSRLEAGGVSVQVRGRVDRIDFCPDASEYMIIDYKTGGTREYPRGMPSKTDFDSIEDIHRRVPTFQLPLYVHLLGQSQDGPSHGVNAKLIFLKNNQEEMLFKMHGEDEREAQQAGYMRGVRTVLSDILDRSKPIRPFDDLACPACPFNLLCHV
jgi:ATP-dependent helicase/nuclease subunit B